MLLILHLNVYCNSDVELCVLSSCDNDCTDGRHGVHSESLRGPAGLPGPPGPRGQDGVPGVSSIAGCFFHTSEFYSNSNPVDSINGISNSPYLDTEQDRRQVTVIHT